MKENHNVNPPMPPPEIKTLGLLRATISSEVKGNFGFPESLMMGYTCGILLPGKRFYAFRGPRD